MDIADEYELNESGIPLGYRYESVLDIPIDVRPVSTAWSVSKFPKGPNGRQGPGPRMGRDQKTYWCRSCETAVSTKTRSWCRPCENERNANARRISRAAGAGRATSVEFRLEVLVELVRRSEAVIDRIALATIEFDRVTMTGGAIDELMIATKELAGYLSREIRPEVQRAKFGTTNAEEAAERLRAREPRT